VAPNDVKILETNSCKTEAFWHYVPNLMNESYVGLPLGHGSHRYVFTVIALDSPLQFEHPEKVTKKDIQNAMIELSDGDKGLGYGNVPGPIKHTNGPLFQGPSNRASQVSYTRGQAEWVMLVKG
jgi:hypothetical protein